MGAVPSVAETADGMAVSARSSSVPSSPGLTSGHRWLLPRVHLQLLQESFAFSRMISASFLPLTQVVEQKNRLRTVSILKNERMCSVLPSICSSDPPVLLLRVPGPICYVPKIDSFVICRLGEVIFILDHPMGPMGPMGHWTTLVPTHHRAF